MARPCWISGCYVFNAVMRRRVAQAAADLGARMFEALAEFARTPPKLSNAACPQGRRIRLAFFCLLFLAKQEK